MKCAEILVTGKVQGVWFRDFVKKTASRLDVCGWVKNNSDGSVSTFVEGDEETVNQLINNLKIGSLLSKVEDVKVNWLHFNNKFNSFKIIQ